MKKSALGIAFFATIVQYYDYALFGMSASFLTKAYMPRFSSGHEMLGFFSIISGAALMRPLGSLIFGYIGDLGSKANALKLSVLVAAISTLVIGIIPENKSLLSACFLVMARMIFMMSMAGESDGVRLYVAEIIGRRREFAGNGLVTFSSQIGVLIASFAYFASTRSNMPEYLWRINFIAGGICGIGIFILRRYLPVNNSLAKPQLTKDEVIKDAPVITARLFILATIIAGCIGGMYHFQVIFFGVFMSQMACMMTLEHAAAFNVIGVAIYAICAIISGFLGDRYGPRRQIILSLALTILLGAALCISPSMYASLCVTALIPFYSVPLQILIKRMMPSHIMLRSFSLSHSLGSMIFSASVPMVASFLWYNTHEVWVPIMYVALMGGVLLISYFLLTTRSRRHAR
ncbi:MAG: MFS transporter [Pseudomonadota bacterium]